MPLNKYSSIQDQPDLVDMGCYAFLLWIKLVLPRKADLFHTHVYLVVKRKTNQLLKTSFKVYPNISNMLLMPI